MATEVLKEFLVAIGFKVDQSSFKKQSETVASYEKSIVAAEKKVDEARLRSARNLEQRNKIEAELHLKALKRGLEEAKATEENQRRQAIAIAGTAATVAIAVATAMAAIASAIRNTIGEFDRLSYVSGRTGASVNNIKAIGYAFSQTGSSAEAAIQSLENFARARRSNPGIDGLLRSYGVGTNGDSSEVLSNALDAITKRHPQYTAQQVGGLLGISPDEVDHWIRYRKEIAEFNKQYKDLQRTFGVNGGEMARASTSISRAMGEFSAVIEVLRDKLVSFFLPAIEAVAKGMTDLLKILTNEENVAAFASYFDKPIAAIKEMVRWVKALYDQFVILFEYVRNSPIGKLLGAINPGFFREKFLDLITPSSAQAGEAFGGGEGGGAGGGGTGSARREPGVVQRGWNAVKRAFGGGAKEDKTSYNFSGANADVLKQAAKELGTSPEDLATVISYESKFRPGVHGGKGGNYQGLIQFGPAERAQFGVNDKQSFSEQMPAVVRYLKTRGFKPGMGLNQLYATINGGNPYVSQNASDGNGTIGQHVARMRVQEAARVRAFLNAGGGASEATKPAQPAAPRFSTMPDTFKADDYLRSQPMGSTSTSNDNSRTVSQNNPVTVNISGAGDPQATASAVTRGVGQAHDMSLRNVQTAIR